MVHLANSDRTVSKPVSVQWAFYDTRIHYARRTSLPNVDLPGWCDCVCSDCCCNVDDNEYGDEWEVSREIDGISMECGFKQPIFQPTSFSTNQDIGQKTISNLKMRRLADKTFFPQPTSRGYLADKEIRKVKATCALNSQESQPTYSKSMETWLHGCIWNWGTPIESSGIIWHPIAFLGTPFPDKPISRGASWSGVRWLAMKIRFVPLFLSPV